MDRQVWSTIRLVMDIGQYQWQFYFFHLSINVLCLGAESGGGEGQDVLSSGTFKGTMSVDLHFL